jgi:hypothetical protein
MGVLRELALRLSADSERRRIRSAALRKKLFDLLKLSEKSVVLGVRKCGSIEDVVLVGSARENDAQLASATMLLLGGRPCWLGQRLIGMRTPGCLLVLFP